MKTNQLEDSSVPGYETPTPSMRVSRVTNRARGGSSGSTSTSASGISSSGTGSKYRSGLSRPVFLAGVGGIQHTDYLYDHAGRVTERGREDDSIANAQPESPFRGIADDGLYARVSTVPGDLVGRHAPLNERNVVFQVGHVLEVSARHERRRVWVLKTLTQRVSLRADQERGRLQVSLVSPVNLLDVVRYGILERPLRGVQPLSGQQDMRSGAIDVQKRLFRPVNRGVYALSLQCLQIYGRARQKRGGDRYAREYGSEQFPVVGQPLEYEGGL